MGALMVPADQMAGGWELAGMEEVMAVVKVGGAEWGGLEAVHLVEWLEAPMVAWMAVEQMAVETEGGTAADSVVC
jgi:hypothetical protein